MIFVLLFASALAKKHHSRRKERSGIQENVGSIENEIEEGNLRKSDRKSRKGKKSRGEGTMKVKTHAETSHSESKLSEDPSEKSDINEIQNDYQQRMEAPREVNGNTVEEIYGDEEPQAVEMDLGEGFPMDPADDPLAVDMHEYR